MADLLTSSPVMADGDMPSMPDPIFNRLLKDRIIWMGEEVKDDMANRLTIWNNILNLLVAIRSWC